MLTPRDKRAPLAALMSVLLASGCANGLFSSKHPTESAPAVDQAAASATQVAQYLKLQQRLLQGGPAEQAEIVANAQRDYDTAPTPSHQLKLALVLGTSGHPSTNLPRAEGLMRELMANPENLLPGERTLTFVELSQIDDALTLEAENRRLQSELAHADLQRQTTANHRLQAELDENARLRKELEEARAKLDAIANIERSLNERKPTATGHTP